MKASGSEIQEQPTVTDHLIPHFCSCILGFPDPETSKVRKGSLVTAQKEEQ